jgi:hypothetical protein
MRLKSLGISMSCLFALLADACHAPHALDRTKCGPCPPARRAERRYAAHRSEGFRRFVCDDAVEGSRSLAGFLAQVRDAIENPILPGEARIRRGSDSSVFLRWRTTANDRLEIVATASGPEPGSAESVARSSYSWMELEGCRVAAAFSSGIELVGVEWGAADSAVRATIAGHGLEMRASRLGQSHVSYEGRVGASADVGAWLAEFGPTAVVVSVVDHQRPFESEREFLVLGEVLRRLGFEEQVRELPARRWR